MVPPKDDLHKGMAVISIDACTECGFCVADCDYDAIRLEDSRQQDFLKTIYGVLSDRKEERDRGERFLQVFICERSIDLKDILTADMTTLKNVDHTLAIPVSCIGVVTPTIIKNSLRAGAAGVAVVGCQTLDCQFREGMRQEGSLAAKHEKIMTGSDELEKTIRIMTISAFDSKGVEEELREFLKELKDGEKK
jgi:coenzyme F420-reducing hydrogenase delta subunit